MFLFHVAKKKVVDSQVTWFLPSKNERVKVFLLDEKVCWG